MSVDNSAVDPANRDADPPFELVGPAGVLATTLEVIGTVVDECVIRCDEDGLHVTAVDPATVALVDLELAAEGFESYAADDRTIGVDLDRLSHGLDLLEPDQLVQLSIVPDTGKLQLESGSLEYVVTLLDPETIRRPPSIDDLELEANTTTTVALESRTIAEAIRAARPLSDHVEFGVLDAENEEPAFYVAAAGDTDEMRLTHTPDDLRELTPNSARSVYSLDYLTAFDRGLPRDVNVDLRLGTDAPVEFRFAFAAGAGTVRYVLSPRIRSG